VQWKQIEECELFVETGVITRVKTNLQGEAT
jgi:hypothetical protein